MTTNQTIDGVPRALLEKLYSCARGLEALEWVELRALLDEPANKCGNCGAETVQACNDRGCFFLESGNGEPAAQPHGKTQAWELSKGGMKHAIFTFRPSWADEEGFEVRELIYAEQPAPVAVVLDDNVEFEKWWMSTPILRKQKIQIAQEAWFARANLSK